MKSNKKKILFLLLIFVLILFYFLYRREGFSDYSSYLLPKIFWTHWHDKNFPDYIEKNVEKWKKLNPDWDAHLLTTDEMLAIIPQEEIPPKFKEFGHAAQSDWIRLKLLSLHGGCWMDSGIILNSSLEPLWKECSDAKADLLIFTLDALGSNPKYPVGESWFIMAPQQSPVISLWFKEFDTAMKVGFQEYKKLLQSEGVDLQRIFGSQEETYLTIHACFQKVIQKLLPDAKIVYKRAEDSMLKIQNDCKFDADCIHRNLQDIQAVKKLPYVKLRGCDRKDVDILSILKD
jgi:hypothetical protein